MGEHKDEADGKTSSFTSKEKTPTYGSGKSGTVETTALAAYAMLQSPNGQLGRIDRAIGYLLGNKDTFGNWYSTQATILSLKALLSYGGHTPNKGKGTITVTVDGKAVASLKVDAATDALQALDLPQATVPGRHEVALVFDGTGRLAYQLVGRYFEPRLVNAGDQPSAGELQVATRLDRTHLKMGEGLVEEVRFSSRSGGVDMPIVTAGLPPGFDVDKEELDRLVKTHVVEKVQQTPRELIFYLTRLEEDHPLAISLHLRSRFPERVQVPPATVYEYYKPEKKAIGAPLTVTVDG